MLNTNQMASEVVSKAAASGNLGSAKTQYRLTVTTAADDTDYVFTITVGTTAFVFTVNSGAGATTTTIATAIANAITNDTDNDTPGFIDEIVAASSATNVVTIKSKVAGGVDFTVTESDANMTLIDDGRNTESADQSTIETDVRDLTGAIVGGTLSVTLTADEDDYNPTGLDTATHLRTTQTLVRVIGGIVPNHHFLFITNVSTTHAMVLEDESTSGSSPANRFALGGSNETLLIGESRLVFYDTVSSRWRLVR